MKRNLGLLRRSDPDAGGHVAVRLEEDRHVEDVDVLAEDTKVSNLADWLGTFKPSSSCTAQLRLPLDHLQSPKVPKLFVSKLRCEPMPLESLGSHVQELTGQRSLAANRQKKPSRPSLGANQLRSSPITSLKLSIGRSHGRGAQTERDVISESSSPYHEGGSASYPDLLASKRNHDLAVS